MIKKHKITLVFFILLGVTCSAFTEDKDQFSSVIHLRLKEKNRSSLLSINTEKKSYQPVGYFNLNSPADSNKKSRKLNTKKQYKPDALKLTILGAAGLGVFTAMHIYYQNTWWKDQVTYFKFAEDGYYARNMDKASHFFTANCFTVVTGIAYEWAGIHPDKALLYGAITSMAYETYIEVNDGFAPNWGFDWVDMGANFAGALYPFLQKAVPIFENVNVKWSFQPGWIKKKTSSDPDDLLDDYTNMTFWLSVNPMMVLPKSFTNGKYYPNFLAFALGMNIKDASHVTGSTNAETQWYISIDWDITKLPGKSDFMVKLKKILNFYHFPAPAVRISPSGVWYGLYF
jgi:hypothetical protein